VRETKQTGSETFLGEHDLEPNPKMKELAMKKLLVAGVAGLMLMAVAGAGTANAAPWRGARHERFVNRPVYRTGYGHSNYFRGPVYRPYCW